MFFCIKIAREAIYYSNNECQVNIGYTLLMVLIWQFLHGLGESFWLIGEQHQMIVLAVLLGLCLSKEDIIE